MNMRAELKTIAAMEKDAQRWRFTMATMKDGSPEDAMGEQVSGEMRERHEKEEAEGRPVQELVVEITDEAVRRLNWQG